MSDEFAIAARDTCAIAGVGTTEYSRDSRRSTLALAAEAARAAIADAGLPLDAIDGIVRCDLDRTMSSSLAATLGLRHLNFWADTGPGGIAPSMMIGIAVGAVLSGQAEAVLCFRSINSRSEERYGAPTGHGQQIGGQGTYDEFYAPFGLITPGQYFAMVTQQHMRRYGTRPEDLGAIAIACRNAANRTPHAQMHDKPLTMDAYLASRPIATPLRLFDFCLESDGACAVVVTSAGRARDLARPPVLVRAVAGGKPADARPGMIYTGLSRNDITDLGAREAGDALWRRAGLGPADMDLAQFYDCYTISVLLQLEAFGFCAKGEGGAFASSGAIVPGGAIPINTAGGNMSEGYVAGMNHIVEAVRQLRGEASNQMAHAETALVTSGLFPFGAGLVLRSDA